MEILFIVLLVILAFLVGIFFGGIAKAPEIIELPITSRFDYFTCSEYEHKIENLRRDNIELQSKMRFMQMTMCPESCYRANRTCHHCEPRVYARSPDEQKLVEIITKGMKSAEQLVKDLKL